MKPTNVFRMFLNFHDLKPNILINLVLIKRKCIGIERNLFITAEISTLSLSDIRYVGVKVYVQANKMLKFDITGFGSTTARP